ncbi:unnamed protein product [Caenorhabditis auriculariae]|uniref:DNA ligase n=1 Tax=Caenorhabditis auriculariae TaxID=2777116 RepID=A0A8S1HFE5_9PELO|nr:unnamed protein product [Caenorhabditis auriculariae]
MSAPTRFLADYGKRNSGCKKCKVQMEKGELRMGKIIPNFFVQREDAPPPDMKQYFHVNCLFEMLFKARATTKVIESRDEIEGFEDLKAEDQEKIGALVDELVEKRSRDGVASTPKTPKPKKTKEAGDDGKSTAKKTEKAPPKKKSKEEPRKRSSKKFVKESDSESEEISESESEEELSEDSEEETPKKRKVPEKRKSPPKSRREESKTSKDVPKDVVVSDEASQFNSFSKFVKLCEVIGSLAKLTDKSSSVKSFITKAGYDGDKETLFQLLLPGIDQRVYNIKEKQIINVFSQMLNLESEELTRKYKADGDVSEVVREAVEGVRKNPRSDWSIQKINRWLSKLAELSTEAEQLAHFKFIAKRLSPVEIQYVVRLVLKDLRINAGVATILEGLHPKANSAFQSCRDLSLIIKRQEEGTLAEESSKGGIQLGSPVLPMLADACKSVDQILKKFKNDIFAEIKYDGERVQIHKKGHKFTFYSRSLRPVQEHKISTLKDTVTHAFPQGENLIIDSEILLVDTATGKPLPFGTLGVHKKEKQSNASVCLYVFDILMYNDEDLTARPLEERKEILKTHMMEIQNKVLFSNCQRVNKNDGEHLKKLIWKAIDEGLEGLVVKDVRSIYEPGLRRWLKVKKDYLEDGKMADTADLIVLGGYFGTGSKGGKLSIFLMGVQDKDSGSYLTVCKCGNGLTDQQIDKFNKELLDKMERIDGRHSELPSWFKCAKGLVPDYVIKDPKEAPIWEITGAEFSKSTTHTAGGMSIRFPRVTRLREDKTAETATSLAELKRLFEASKSNLMEEHLEVDETPLYAKENVPMEKEVIKNEKESVVISDDDTEKDECPEDMEPCRYGAECYRKNQEHKKNFWHPSK